MSDDAELAHAIAGAGGGALSMIVTYPLITLSTLAQTTSKKKEAEDDQIEASSKCEIRKALLDKGGIKSLYAGLESALYGITLLNFIYYYFYELTSNVFLKSNAAAQRRKRGLSTLQLIITGAIAGAITVVGTNPFWVANTRMMTMAKEDGKSRSAFRALLEIAQKDGISTLFAGVLPALVLVINPIIQYTIFEQIKNMIVAQKGSRGFSAKKAFFIGAFGKLVATTLTYPYITLKSRMHVRKKSPGTDPSAAEQKADAQLSMYQEIKKIVAEEGMEGLYRGLAIKSFQSVTTAAFLFYFKEELFAGSLSLVGILRGRKMAKTLV
ncbi:mitochondrial carrier [Metschnikowia bicuspidata var. bicuspidata NRRL YB-4993]|uniref:Mitochondrial carrier n=1 Tax=Metschnikowia bicuspidata var. bicuspidata NRRL YB-4993 TaxID=869754 RepID=A0A1A0H928_9ASCO|nr:mitochondrial carrier [Metschnikowia bicuspidata var. bicuspidata NRRL YB-4993]OBA20629.1 mitochondrial carrier [Metschnikowia bicuspidata var. bicuspidata NRRL YB-4993]